MSYIVQKQQKSLISTLRLQKKDKLFTGCFALEKRTCFKKNSMCSMYENFGNELIFPILY